MSKTKFKADGKYKFSFQYKDNDLLLIKEKSARMSSGEVMNLYQEKKGIKTFVKTIGWIVDDGQGGCLNGKSYIRGLTTVDNCKAKTIEYLKKLLS